MQAANIRKLVLMANGKRDPGHGVKSSGRSSCFLIYSNVFPLVLGSWKRIFVFGCIHFKRRTDFNSYPYSNVIVRLQTAVTLNQLPNDLSLCYVAAFSQ